MINDSYKLKTEFDNSGMFLAFCGPLSQELLVEIGDTLRNKMKLEEAGLSTTTKIFSMLVEQAQNIIHYSSEKVPENELGTGLSSGLLITGYDNGHYYVLCGNKVNNETVELLKGKLVTLRNMDKDELRRYYKEQRKKNTPEDSKGAGLGFIELARKSVKPIEFSFQPIDEHFSFFSLKTYI